MTTASVFISYSQDNAAHMADVLNLANRLRLDGVDCELDQFHEAPPEGWPVWTSKRIIESAFVLIVCTETYNLRFEGKDKAGSGKGAKWEGSIITQALYDSEQHNTHFIPVLLDARNRKHIPVLLRGASFYDLSSADGYLQLLRRLTEQPHEKEVPLGPKATFDDRAAREAEEIRFDKDVATTVQYYTAKLGSWPAAEVDSKKAADALTATLAKVEANAAYRMKFPAIRPTIYRMIGGTYLVDPKLEMADKLRSALPHLKRSLEIWPDQALFAGNVSFLEACLNAGSADIKTYLTTVFQILRGPGNPEIPALVEGMFAAAHGPEQQARQWLFQEATANPVWNFLQAVQIMLKQESNIDADIEVSTKQLADSLVEIEVHIGPNVFLWRVDYGQRTYTAMNDLTAGFMRIVQTGAANAATT